MVGKEGWLRVVEASISVLLIIGAILVIPAAYERSEDNSLENGLQFAVRSIAENVSLRESILGYNVLESSNSTNNSPIVQKINGSLYSSLKNFNPTIHFGICLANETCVLSANNEEESYSVERIIGTTIANNYFLPKRIKVVAW